MICLGIRDWPRFLFVQEATPSFGLSKRLLNWDNVEIIYPALRSTDSPYCNALAVSGTNCALWARLKGHILQYCLSLSSFKLCTHVLLDKHLTEQQRLRQQTDPLRHLPAQQNMHMVFLLSTSLPTSLPTHRDSFSAQVSCRLPESLIKKATWTLWSASTGPGRCHHELRKSLDSKQG